MTNFKVINKSIQSLVNEYKNLEVDNSDADNSEYMTSHRIKVQNLPMELREYSSKVLQLAKVIGCTVQQFKKVISSYGSDKQNEE